MDVAFLLIVPGLLWVQSWYLLGLLPNPRSLGIVAVGVAIALFAVLVFQDQLTTVVTTPAGGLIEVTTPISVLVLVWTVYAVAVAGVYLWGFEPRALGHYGLFLCVVSGLLSVYFFVGGELLENGDIKHVSWLLGSAAGTLTFLAGMLFAYMAFTPYGLGESRSSLLRKMTGWAYLAGSIAVAALGGLLLLGLNPS